MSLQTHCRLDLAARQLETAIGLFIGGYDKFSVIALASAADGILSQLVNNEGKKTLIQIMADESDDESTASRSGMGAHVNKLLSINAVKHMDEGEDDYVNLDLFDCALTTILIAVADFVTLCGREIGFVEVFLLWVKQNLDPKVYNVDCDPHWKSDTAAKQDGASKSLPLPTQIRGHG
jgi:hypothetical protein